ncbi:MAG: N-acetylneuraminate synthase [Gammaproteobacteria bacterium]|nr:N-acetylneuraminate synthase [Gammaproteobacteria bacterium]
MVKKITINGRAITESSEPYIVAEIGSNHQGNVTYCKKMIIEAQEAGADAVKLQKKELNEVYTKTLLNSPYNSPHTFGDTYGKHKEALEFSYEEMYELKKFCDDVGITLFVTPFDFKSLVMLDTMGMPAYKIASGDLLNWPLIKSALKTGKPVIVSTGGHNLIEIRATDSKFKDYDNLAFLHCTAEYPVYNSEHINLQMIRTLCRKLPNRIIGYSSHAAGDAAGPDVPFLAGLLYGAKIIEVHFTLKRENKGTDNAFSLEPQAIRKIKDRFKNVQIWAGDGIKKVYPEEQGPINKMAKSIYPTKCFKKGHIFNDFDLVCKSPKGDGIAPYMKDDLIGMSLINDSSTAVPIQWEDVE